MNRFAQAVARAARLSSSLSPVASADEKTGDDLAPTGSITADQLTSLQADYDADVADARREGVEQGRKEANERFNAVLTSDAGKANRAQALVLLGNDKLTAEEIIGMLPALASSPEAKPVAGPAGNQPEGRHLAQTQPLDLQPAGDGDEETSAAGGKDAKDGAGKSTWAKVQKGPNALTDGGMRGAVTAH